MLEPYIHTSYKSSINPIWPGGGGGVGPKSRKCPRWHSTLISFLILKKILNFATFPKIYLAQFGMRYLGPSNLTHTITLLSLTVDLSTNKTSMQASFCDTIIWIVSSTKYVPTNSEYLIEDNSIRPPVDQRFRQEFSRCIINMQWKKF